MVNRIQKYIKKSVNSIEKNSFARLSCSKRNTLDRLYTAETLKEWVEKRTLKQIEIGFVPTMGALHKGHISLIERAKSENDVVICSVFVNPTQFNNASDLTNYPRTIESDIILLEEAGCDAVFIPSVTEMYPDYPKKTTFVDVPLAPLNEVMEGTFRKGHFEGVVNVVYRLFDLVKPNRAYFGLKDFQQVAIIKHMVKYLKLPVEIVPCSTMRTDEGLAKSSRNARLSDTEKEEALIIYKTLQFGKSLSLSTSPIEVREKMLEFFEKGNLKLEYIEIVNPDSLESLSDKWVSGAVCCIAAYCGEVRLIDNMQFIP